MPIVVIAGYFVLFSMVYNFCFKFSNVKKIKKYFSVNTFYKYFIDQIFFYITLKIDFILKPLKSKQKKAPWRNVAKPRESECKRAASKWKKKQGSLWFLANKNFNNLNLEKI